MTIDRQFVPTRSGRIHIASAGQGFPVLLLHQTPRSWDEYRDVLPLIGARYRAIAMDTAGFGDSDPLPAADNTIERWAEVAFDLLDALGLQQVALVGHHTGAAVALEMAASRPERVSALVLSACPFVDAPRRAAHHGKRIIDEVERMPGGEHLTELWQRRMPFYPPCDHALLERFIADALKAGDLAVEGHRVVNRYAMETRTPLVTSPTLVLAPTEDPHAFPAAPRVAQAIAGSRLLNIEHGMVPLPDQMPGVFSEAVMEFLATLKLPG
ncbi:alpha/beta fold hydrolase [Variovorax sp. PAMC28562]|uniref:alpha/beta fold hydrolase n=1 Tax=Variovorax sp. PAMC28562 TaxID=2762323 RepID=UPI00164EAB87|nr:alpha/beta fold hydrolase [Variovorax sp. PAMC28562]QNK72879.1 alpha/beta fold hydrolase [Variovorax sp. PAMC28562]